MRAGLRKATKASSTDPVAQTAVFAVCGFSFAMRVVYVLSDTVSGIGGHPARSMGRPQRRFCSAALMPEYSLKLDHFQSCGRETSPALTGFMWMYSPFSLYSFTVRRARSKRSCHSERSEESLYLSLAVSGKCRDASRSLP